MDSEVKEFLDYLHEISHKVLKLPRKFVKSFEDIDSDSEMSDADRKFSEWINNNNFFNSNKNMGKKKELYLVWQNWGDADSIETKLCGVYDDEEKALELKARLDKKVVNADNCWSIMPKDVYCQWPIIDADGSECDNFEFVSEFSGYTCEQRDEQEKIWIDMVDAYKEAVIETVYMNTEL